MLSLNPHTHTKARTLDGYHWIDATWHLVSTGMWWEGGGMAGWGAAADSQEHRSWSLHLWDPLFKYSDPRGLCPSASPYRSRETLTVRSLCQQRSCINGGKGLLLRLTDCLHLLSELCHMLECTTWLRLGQRRRPLLPLRGPVRFKCRAELTFSTSPLSKRN